MSRSRKKVAVWKIPNDRYFKRYSNKKIRHRDLPSGASFKRVLNPYSICDFCCRIENPDDAKIALRK